MFAMFAHQDVPHALMPLNAQVALQSLVSDQVVLQAHLVILPLYSMPFSLEASLHQDQILKVA
jgi:hypothetical protein